MADDATIFRKTEKGRTEIQAAGRTLDRRLRPLLILIDGSVSTGRLLALTAKFGGQRADFDALLDAGMIEPAPTQAPLPGPEMEVAPDGAPGSLPAVPDVRGAYERFSQGQRYLNETVSDKLGLKATFFILRIARCGTAEELQALLPEFENLLAKRFDSIYARHCRTIAETILAP
jgi:hypothetical protein